MKILWNGGQLFQPGFVPFQSAGFRFAGFARTSDFQADRHSGRNDGARKYLNRPRKAGYGPPKWLLNQFRIDGMKLCMVASCLVPTRVAMKMLFVLTGLCAREKKAGISLFAM